ncbi:hypothetical protein PsorP6_009701 [Peronosclerospora sorghi]|uniref:Uncharacterized protein n=1 Tax=Peronosclerospora sorghi TaxID=230839 RepID=A0ACC0W0N6_9STRA|nr:hypothetical protein PsorP6_009701 [Peronosclerospora sorghi]
MYAAKQRKGKEEVFEKFRSVARVIRQKNKHRSTTESFLNIAKSVMAKTESEMLKSAYCIIITRAGVT